MFTNFVNKFHRLDQTEIRRSWLLVSITCHPHVRKRRERETKNSIVCRNSDRSIINGGTHRPIQRVVSRSTCTSFYGSNNLQLCHRVELFLCGTRLFSSTLYASEIHFFFLFFGSLHLALCSLHSSSICTFSLGGNRGTELEQRETLFCRNFVIFPLWSVLRVWVWWKIERKSRTFPENIVRAEEIIPVFELWMMDRICFFNVK